MLSGRANGTPKDRDGTVEAIRTLRVVCGSAIKARTQTINQLKSLIITAPAATREAPRSLTTTEGALLERVARAAREIAVAAAGREPPALVDPCRHPVPFEQLLGGGSGEAAPAPRHTRQRTAHMRSLRHTSPFPGPH
ncbi:MULTISPECIES: hypothetical protein [unclassified Streptomyces]|uniref:hypothetical protein n=1 Tax=unclassified Streptomyces TaxID=2593676 RepID=UPI002E30D186|nr:MULTISPECIES: hypothetical protein [unclassified Streptomyces]